MIFSASEFTFRMSDIGHTTVKGRSDLQCIPSKIISKYYSNRLLISHLLILFLSRQLLAVIDNRPCDAESIIRIESMNWD